VAVGVACAVGCALPALLLGGFSATGAVAVLGTYGSSWLAIGVGVLCTLVLVVKAARHRTGGSSA
jgi:hypothetical protein